MKSSAFPSAEVVALRIAIGCFVAAALTIGSNWQPAIAQEAAKGPPPKPLEVYQQIRSLIGEGKYDLAAIFLQSFVNSNPNEKDLLDIEERFGSTVFRQLRNVTKWSDDEKLEKQARENVETVIKKAADATEKILKNPTRVNKFIRNLGATYEEQQFAEYELRRTGDYAIPFMVDMLRANPDPALSDGIIRAIAKLEPATMAGWLAALDGLTAERQYAVLATIAARPDVLSLISSAQTDFIPYLWHVQAQKDAPTLREFASELLRKLVRGSEKKHPEIELVGFARAFADGKARFAATLTNPDGPTTVGVWVWNAADMKLVKLENVPIVQANEYFGLRYARWALDIKPEFEPAQVMVLTIATNSAMDRGNFGDLAKTDPAVYRLLAEAPTTVLTDLLGRSLFEKRTGLVLAITQALGERGEKDPAVASPGKPSLLERGLSYPDPRVQLAAANGLLRAPVPVAPGLRARIVEILKRAAALDSGAPHSGKGQAILVDPSRLRAGDTATLLRTLGYDVEVYATGKDLLRRVARSSDVDLILIDHHVPNPELVDLVSHLQIDLNSSRRPILVVASADKAIPPSLDQLLLRLAELIAATDDEAIGMPEPFVPNPRQNPDQWAKERQTSQQRRDFVFRTFAKVRVDRLLRVVDTTGLEFTADQKQQLLQRMEQFTYAALAAEFPLTAESSPVTFANVQALKRQLNYQPKLPSDSRKFGVDHLMKLIERFEVDVAKSKSVLEKYDRIRKSVDTEGLGLVVHPPRDFAIEARVAKLMRSHPSIRVIPEPYSKVGFEADVNAAFADPADRPRDPAEKKASAKLAVEWLVKMATGEIVGFDVKPAAPEILAALRVEDLTDIAIDGASHITTADAQQALIALSLNVGRPLSIRSKAADAAIRHVQANGKLTGDSLIAPLVEQSGKEVALDLRGKLLVLKGLIAPNAKDYLSGLRSYAPPVVPPPPAVPVEPKPKQE